MERQQLEALLNRVRTGELPVGAALEELRDFPTDSMGFANLDTHRGLRQGFPEVVFGPGKSDQQLLEIVSRIRARQRPLLVTRLAEETAHRLLAAFPELRWNPLARTLSFQQETTIVGVGLVLVITAGTSDIPVAEEAAETARLLGNNVETVFDVGVAGIHRLLERRKLIYSANVLIVVAGMEGALPSVVGGLVDRPVIAVPTSIGYGTSFNGLTALLGMLNSCASNVVVTNIDNGFGAGFVASLINRAPREIPHR